MGAILAVLMIVLVIAVPVLMFTLPIYFLRKRKNKKLRSNIGKCQNCGKKALMLKQTTIKGVVLLVEYRTFKEWLCLNHGHELYGAVKSFNLKNGWWSLLGIVRTPFMLQENNYEFSRFSKELRSID